MKLLSKVVGAIGLASLALMLAILIIGPWLFGVEGWKP